jgi:transcriptional regulator with XRE-family HTH domain
MEQWRRGVSIGESLAEARRGAGLSVTQVSQRTRIRETIIRDIERGDYSSCGGDFYAPGHIRAIARAVGADPGPLIGEYDATQRAPDPVTAAELFRPVTPVRLRERRRVNWAAALGLALVAAAGFVAYLFVSGSRHPPAVLPAAGTGPAIHRPARASSPPPAATATQVPLPYAHTVVIRLVAIEDCWVEFTTPGGGYLFQSYVAAGTSKAWSFRHAVAMRLGNPGGITLTVDGKNPLPPGTSYPITLSLGLNGQIST